MSMYSHWACLLGFVSGADEGLFLLQQRAYKSMEVASMLGGSSDNLPCALAGTLGQALAAESHKAAMQGAVCSAFAPRWNNGNKCEGITSKLHFDQWFQQGGKNGYFQIEYVNPQTVTSFSLECTRSPAFQIKYSDDGVNFVKAYTSPTSTVNPKVEWGKEVGPHKVWRYELTGEWSGGPWYNNPTFNLAIPCDENALVPCQFMDLLGENSCDKSTGKCYTSFQEFTGGSCSSHATKNVENGYCMDSGMDGNTKRGMTSNLHFDGAQAYLKSDPQWYQIDTGDTPQAFSKFSMGFDNAPTVAILHSDNGEDWTEVARMSGDKDTRIKKPQFVFPYSGAHRYWRAQLTGDRYASGPWYHMMLWHTPIESSATQCDQQTQTPCSWLPLIDNGVQDTNMTGAVCNANAYQYKPKSADGCPKTVEELKWKKWVEFRGRPGYFEVKLGEPRMITSASFETNNNPVLDFEVHIVDENGPQLVEANPVATLLSGNKWAGRHELKWKASGAYQTWRFVIRDEKKAMQGGYFKWQLHEAVIQDCTFTGTIEITTSTTTTTTVGAPNTPTYLLPLCCTGHDAEEKLDAETKEECSAFAPGLKPPVLNCDTSSTNLHWDGWWENDDTAGHYTTKFKTPVSVTRFTASISRSPAFKLRFSDDGESWEDVGSYPSQRDPNITWDSVGAHQFWKYQLNGDWKGGPWYQNLEWYREPFDPECNTAPQPLCDAPYDMVFSTATHNLNDPADPYLRWEKVLTRKGKYIDLLLVPVGDNNWSGKNVAINENVGLLNLASRDDEQFVADILLVLHGTRTPVQVDNFLFSVLDIDKGKKGRACKTDVGPCATQSITTSGFDKYYVSDTTEITVSTSGGQTVFTATGKHGKENNPGNLKNLTELQSNAAVTFRYSNVNKIRMSFGVTLGKGKRNFRNFMFGGSTSLACPADRTTTTTTPVPPEKCGGLELECPENWAQTNGGKCYEQCTSWRDPHFTRNFYSTNAEGAFDAYNEGLFDLVTLKDNTLKVQGFLCDSGGGTTAWAGFAMRIRGNSLSWTRKPNTTVSGCATGITCLPDQMKPKDAWSMMMNGKEIAYKDLPTWTDGYGNYIMPDKKMKVSGLVSDYKYPDGEPMCIGDVNIKSFIIRTGLQSKAPGNQILPSMHIEVAKGSGKAQGLCGSSADRRPISADNSLFSTSELAQLCNMCGMVSGSGGACVPPTTFHQAFTPKEACDSKGVDYAQARNKCKTALSGVENQDAWLDACVVEYCVSGGDDAEVENALNEDKIEEVEANR